MHIKLLGSGPLTEPARLTILLKRRPQYLPAPRFSGIVLLILTAASFLIAETRHEIILRFIAAVFLFLLFYTFVAVLVLSIVHRCRVRNLNSTIVPEKIRAGEETHLILNEQSGKQSGTLFFELPAILIRYSINLSTRDNKKIKRTFPRTLLKTGEASFTAPRRGEYFGIYDEITISDCFGFFYFTYKIMDKRIARLFVTPLVEETNFPVSGFSGGSARRNENEIVRTDDLIEQRPYIPGDDPRRINWKLYGHSGSLFVREEDREPPPHSILVMLLCTEVDSFLYPRSADEDYKDAAAGAKAVDNLCECALAIALQNGQAGVSVLIGGNGITIQGDEAGTINKLLALPFAFSEKDFEKGGLDLPDARQENSVLILALVHSYIETDSGNSPFRAKYKNTNSSLDKFLQKKPLTQKASILFLYRDEKLIGSAEACAIQYSRRDNVRAKAVRF
jgi:hypothetical protein